mgnify:CR=1 FL=1
MYKELIQTCKSNVRSLKSSLGICESQITFGTLDVKNKYRKDKVSLLSKLKEETYWLTQYTLVNHMIEYYGSIIKPGQYTHRECQRWLSSENVKII